MAWGWDTSPANGYEPAPDPQAQEMRRKIREAQKAGDDDKARRIADFYD